MEVFDISNPSFYVWFAAGFGLGILFSLVLARTGVLFFWKKWEDVSNRALYKNTEQFIGVAEKYFSGYVAQARQDFQTRGSQIQQSIDPVRHALDQYGSRLQNMEKERARAYGEIGEKLASLNQETAQLANALKKPHVRGRWGEITLKRVVELAGMKEHCDFVQQFQIGGDKGRLRPDMVVHLPSGRKVVVDAKTPLDAYMEAQQAKDSQEEALCMTRHARQVMAHVRELSGKNYQSYLPFSPEFVILFLPGENFFSAALDHAPDLIEKAAQKGVILTTPTTLIALLKAVSYSWLQEKTYENAESIRILGGELYHRMSTMADTMNQLGRDIERSCTSFNRLTGSMETRVMPAARKLKQMGLDKAGSEISFPSPLTSFARTMKKRDSLEEP